MGGAQGGGQHGALGLQGGEETERTGVHAVGGTEDPDGDAGGGQSRGVDGGGVGEDAGVGEPGAGALEGATAVFFTGGDQLHITALMGGTEMDKLIKRRHGKGLLLGGTSAGAAMMSNSMLLGGDGECNPRSGAVEIGPGMDFVVGAVIDTHFSQRGRHGRLIAAVAHYPQDLGLGLDEDTAIVVTGD